MSENATPPSQIESDAALEKVRIHKSDSEADYSEYKSNHLKFWKVYNCFRDASKYGTRSNLFIPYVFSFIESAVANQMQEFVTAPNDQDLVILRPEEGSSPGTAYLKGKIINKQLRLMGIVRKLMDFVRQGNITGSTS